MKKILLGIALIANIAIGATFEDIQNYYGGKIDWYNKEYRKEIERLENSESVVMQYEINEGINKTIDDAKIFDDGSVVKFDEKVSGNYKKTIVHNELETLKRLRTKEGFWKEYKNYYDDLKKLGKIENELDFYDKIIKDEKKVNNFEETVKRYYKALKKAEKDL